MAYPVKSSTNVLLGLFIHNSSFSENLNEMLGELFLPKETPEAPKQGFLKSLFGGGVSTLDREELCKYYRLLDVEDKA